MVSQMTLSYSLIFRPRRLLSYKLMFAPCSLPNQVMVTHGSCDNVKNRLCATVLSN